MEQDPGLLTNCLVAVLQGQSRSGPQPSQKGLGKLRVLRGCLSSCPSPVNSRVGQGVFCPLQPSCSLPFGMRLAEWSKTSHVYKGHVSSQPAPHPRDSLPTFKKNSQIIWEMSGRSSFVPSAEMGTLEALLCARAFLQIHTLKVELTI